MEGESRRKEIIDLLKNSTTPLSGGDLSKTLNVSRQIIVGDIALLRVAGENIISTNKGYVYDKSALVTKPVIVVKASHRSEDIYDELCSIIDVGGRIKDIFIEHPAYGKVSIDLSISNRMDAGVYAEKFMDKAATPLFEISRGVHYHTIEADDQIAIIRIQKALNDKGYLVK